MTDLPQRRSWFEQHFPLGVACPCCGCPTLAERQTYEICVICGWEDDGQDDADADEVRGGPNGSYSLTTARTNFRNLGTMYDSADDRGRMASDVAAARRALVAAYDALATHTTPPPQQLLNAVSPVRGYLRDSFESLANEIVGFSGA